MQRACPHACAKTAAGLAAAPGGGVKNSPPTVRDEASSAERFSPSQAETEDPVRLAIDAAEIGAWNWHIASGHVEWTPWTYQLFGQRPGVAVSKEWFLDCVHPEDRRGVADWLSQAVRQGGRTAFEFRIDRPDGSVRWMRSTGRALSDENGHVVRMVGVVEDVTDQQERHANVAPAGIAVSPPAGRRVVLGAAGGAYPRRGPGHGEAAHRRRRNPLASLDAQEQPALRPQGRHRVPA